MMSGNKRACVVVLGDVGRSPRMQYHAMSLRKEGYKVDIVGYAGSAPRSELVFDSNVAIHYMKQPPQFQSAFPRLLAYVLKTLWQGLLLAWTLFRVPRPDFVLLQNPPSVPALPVCWAVTRLRSTALIVDWHNYGYTILSLTLGQTHPLVRFSRLIEKWFGRMAQAHLCVTKAMAEDLGSVWGVEACTLYDRPAEIFRPISLTEKHELLSRLSRQHPQLSGGEPNVTLLTEMFSAGQVRAREDRPGVVVSSTSWTEDEDFSVLLRALDGYDSVATANRTQDYPPLLVIITGKGPLKEYYLREIEDRNWQFVDVCTPWLDPDDYPLVVASADLGICLHTSSSGLDLPMKVLDMFGCGLPVCAIQYRCLSELVVDGVNGLTFGTAEELSRHLLTWFHLRPDGPSEVRKSNLVARVAEMQAASKRWHSAWIETAMPVFLQASSSSSSSSA